MPNADLPTRAIHGVTRLALPGLLLLAACSAGQPTPAPTAGATVTPTAPPTASPNASPAPSGQVGQIDHPTEPTAVVLRMFVGGGFVPMEVALTEMAVFTLYGDNTAVFRPSSPDAPMFDPTAPLEPFVRARMTVEQVDALLAFALDQGGLMGAREDYTDIGVIDAPNTVFTIDAGGVQKQVTIAALAEGSTGPDAADRARFSVLADVLDSFEEEVAKGNVGSTEPYRPAWYRAYLPEAVAGQQGQPIDWPWDDLALEDFPIIAESGFPVGDLTPEQAALVTDVPSGGVGAILIDGPDGKRYSLTLRPLLPDEERTVGGVEPTDDPEGTVEPESTEEA